MYDNKAVIYSPRIKSILTYTCMSSMSGPSTEYTVYICTHCTQWGLYSTHCTAVQWGLDNQLEAGVVASQLLINKKTRRIGGVCGRYHNTAYYWEYQLWITTSWWVSHSDNELCEIHILVRGKQKRNASVRLVDYNFKRSNSENCVVSF